MAKSIKDLLEENKKLQQQLRIANDTIDGIRKGNIDALVIANEKAVKVLTEKTADKTYRILIEKMQEGAVLLNEKGNILFCNSAFARMVHLPLQLVTGSNFKNFIDYSSKDYFDNIFKSKKNILKKEICVYASNGNAIPALLSLSALLLNDDLVFSVILTDVSMLKKNQEDLMIQNQRLEEAEKIAGIGNWTVDLSTDTLSSSNELYRIYGLDPVKDSKKLSPASLINKNDTEALRAVFETAVKNRGSFDTYTHINIPPDNEAKTLRVRGIVVPKPCNTLQIIGTSQDVTSIIKREQELKEDNKKLIAAEKALSDALDRQEHQIEERTKELIHINKELKSFAYVVSHDLKAPLRGIVSICDFILKDEYQKLSDEGREYFEQLKNRIKKMHHMIDGILKYSKTGMITMHKEMLNMEDLVKEIMNSIKMDNNIELNLELNLPDIYADKTTLTQVFQNLIGNAIKFMDKPKGLITVSGVETDGCWEFSVSDNGPGIEKKYFEKIFQIFQTLNSGDNYESTGIGLSIVKKIVEMYNGSIRVESVPGEGARFIFSLCKEEGE